MKRKQFNVIGLSIVAIFIVFATFSFFPDTLASAEDETALQASTLLADNNNQGDLSQPEGNTETNVLTDISQQSVEPILLPNETTQDQSSVDSDVLTLDPEGSIGTNLESFNGSGIISSGLVLDGEDGENIEAQTSGEVIFVPPVSNEKQDVIIYREDDYIETFHSEEMLFHQVPTLTQEDLFEIEPDQIIDHYVVDDGRISVTTTVQGVFLRAKLQR